MGNRFNGSRVSVRVPVNEDPAAKAAEALHVKEITEAEFDAQVVAEPLPVALEFYGKDSKACEALGPRFAAVAEKFAGKVRFLKVLRSANEQLAATLGVTATPTLVFLSAGKEKGERLSGDDIKRTEVKARVEALLGVAPAAQKAAAAP